MTVSLIDNDQDFDDLAYAIVLLLASHMACLWHIVDIE
jgi:hypothetical protein